MISFCFERVTSALFATQNNFPFKMIFSRKEAKIARINRNPLNDRLLFFYHLHVVKKPPRACLVPFVSRCALSFFFDARNFVLSIKY